MCVGMCYINGWNWKNCFFVVNIYLFVCCRDDVVIKVVIGVMGDLVDMFGVNVVVLFKCIVFFKDFLDECIFLDD